MIVKRLGGIAMAVNSILTKCCFDFQIETWRITKMSPDVFFFLIFWSGKFDCLTGEVPERMADHGVLRDVPGRDVEMEPLILQNEKLI